MAQGILERILQEIKTLKPEELLQVQQAVQAQLAPPSYVLAEEQVLQEMLKVGLLTEIKPRQKFPPTPPSNYASPRLFNAASIKVSAKRKSC